MIKTLKIGIGYEMMRMKRNQRETGKWLRKTLEKSGPTYVKIGQFIGNRPDLFGKDVSEEMMTLQSNVEPFKLINKPMENMDMEPFASASIAQVHKGTLQDGRKIVVKIKRPGVDEQLTSEMNSIKQIVNVVMPIMPEMNPLSEWFLDFEKNVIEELDFNNEVKNIQLFGSLYEYDRDIKIPRVIPELSTSDLIVMEYVPSIPLKESTDPVVTSETIMNMFVEQILYNGVIHGDLHAGNMGLMKDGRIVLYDFGNIIRIPTYYQNAVRRMIVAVQNKNANELLESMKDMKMRILDQKAAEEFAVFFFKYIDTLDPKSFSYSSTSIKVPIELDKITLTILRTYSLVEGVCKFVYPQFTYEQVIQLNLELLFLYSISENPGSSPFSFFS
jgi:ubiquinone biosynthesis protein